MAENKRGKHSLEASLVQDRVNVGVHFPGFMCAGNGTPQEAMQFHTA
jgi:hypothetical protein